MDLANTPCLRHTPYYVIPDVVLVSPSPFLGVIRATWIRHFWDFLHDRAVSLSELGNKFWSLLRKVAPGNHTSPYSGLRCVERAMAVTLLVFNYCLQLISLYFQRDLAQIGQYIATILRVYYSSSDWTGRSIF